MLRLSFWLAWFAFFLRFRFLPNDAESCKILCRHIQGLGICAIQWFYNFIIFKYADDDRPLFLESLLPFQTFAQSTTLLPLEKERESCSACLCLSGSTPSTRSPWRRGASDKSRTYRSLMRRPV